MLGRAAHAHTFYEHTGLLVPTGHAIIGFTRIQIIMSCTADARNILTLLFLMYDPRVSNGSFASTRHAHAWMPGKGNETRRAEPNGRQTTTGVSSCFKDFDTKP